MHRVSVDVATFVTSTVVARSSRRARTIVDSMRYSTLLLGTLAIMLSHMVPGCTAGRQPTESTPLQRTADAVREAEANMTDNVIILPALEEDIVAGVRPPPYPVRARLESLVTFFCTVGSPALAQRIVWRHQNATIHGDVLPRSLKGHFYRQATSVDTSYLHIHHVKRDSGGAVECLDPLGPDGEVWRLRTYDLLVTLRAHDAFLAPMRNVSTPLRKFSMTCSGRVDCSRTGWEAHFIWKYDGRFVAAPYHDLRILAGNSHTPALLHSHIDANMSAQLAPDTFCASTLSMSMSPAVSDRPARVDCWLRPDLHTHQWFVQSAYVTFTPSL